MEIMEKDNTLKSESFGNVIEVEVKPDCWKVVDYAKSWKDILDNGWVFIAQCDDGHILMKRNGYLNCFRNKEDEKT